MKIKEITIDGVPYIVGIGNHPSGLGHFITYQHGRDVRAEYIRDFKVGLSLHFITAFVPVIQISSDEFKPLTDYFKPGTQELEEGVTLKPLDEYKNTSAGARFNYFYAMKVQTQAPREQGDILAATALGVHIFQTRGVNCIDGTGEIFQPISAELQVTNPENEGDPFRVVVFPIDGEEPVEFGTDPEVYQENPVFLLNSLDNILIYVRDAAGTIAAFKPEPAPDGIGFTGL